MKNERSGLRSLRHHAHDQKVPRVSGRTDLIEHRLVFKFKTATPTCSAMCSARRNNNYCGRYLYNEHTQLGESLSHHKKVGSCYQEREGKLRHFTSL